MPDGRTSGPLAKRRNMRSGGQKGPQHRAMAARREGASRGRGARRTVRVHGPDQLLSGRLWRHSTADRKPGRQEEPQLGKAKAGEG